MALSQEIKELKDLGDKGGVVEVSIPQELRYAKGDKICFQSDKQKLVGCGKVFKMAESSLFVKVTAKTFAKLKTNYSAIFDGTDGKASLSAEEAAKKTSTKNALRLTYSPIILSPTAYNNVTYAAPSLADSTSSSNSQFWVPERAITMSLISVMFEWGRYISPKSGLFLGLRYRTNPKTSVLADYVAGVSTTYLTIDHTFSGLGLSADYAFYKNDVTNAVNFFLATGLDLESTILDIKAILTDDSTGQTKDLASFNSKLTAMSLRLRPGFEWNFSKWLGIHAGLTMMVPFAKFSTAASATISDNHSADASTASDDFKNAAGHKLAKFGLACDLGMISKF